MTSRTTYETTVQTASTTKAATVATAQTTFQEACNAQGVNVGYTLQSGNYGNFATAVANANKARRDSLYAAEVARQAATDVAKDVLKDSGDKGST
jgi:hypothetical protein